MSDYGLVKYDSLEGLLDDLEDFPTPNMKSNYSVLQAGGKLALEVLDEYELIPMGILQDVNKYMVALKLTIREIEKSQGGDCIDDPIYQALRRLESDIGERQSDHERAKARERINKRYRNLP